jgi:hypothetical protein
MKYCLKCGIVGTILGIILWSSPFIIHDSSIFNLLSSPVCWLVCVAFNSTTCNIICWQYFGLITNIIIYGIIGALIGETTEHEH